MIQYMIPTDKQKPEVSRLCYLEKLFVPTWMLEDTWQYLMNGSDPSQYPMVLAFDDQKEHSLSFKWAKKYKAPIGAALVVPYAEDPSYMVYVRPEYRRQGIGREMLIRLHGIQTEAYPKQRVTWSSGITGSATFYTNVLKELRQKES